MHNHDTDIVHGHDHGHGNTILSELMCHFPYAVFSVAFALSVLSFLVYISFLGNTDQKMICQGSDALFHSFHFMHIVFAATGTLITFFRYSQNIIRGLLVGLFSASVFCTLSDVVFPYLAGSIMGVHMHFHICFMTEMHNILPFLVVGLINGFIMSRHHASQQERFSIFSHFVHILVSSFASMFYLVSHGCTDWYLNIGYVFLFLVVAVVVPCTLSDVVVPMTFAQADKKHAKH